MIKVKHMVVPFVLALLFLFCGGFLLIQSNSQKAVFADNFVERYIQKDCLQKQKLVMQKHKFQDMKILSNKAVNEMLYLDFSKKSNLFPQLLATDIHKHDGLTFNNALVDGGTLTGGTYYLTQDLNIDNNAIVIPESTDVYLCLNGFTLSSNATIINYGNLRIYDCESNGKIEVFAKTCIENYGQLFLYSGELNCNNQTSAFVINNCGAIAVCGGNIVSNVDNSYGIYSEEIGTSVLMTRGKISTGNFGIYGLETVDCKLLGGEITSNNIAVCCGAVTVGGDVIVGKQSATGICLTGNERIVIDAQTPLTKKAQIGVSIFNDQDECIVGTFASGVSTDKYNNFYSDNSNFVINIIGVENNFSYLIDKPCYVTYTQIGATTGNVPVDETAYIVGYNTVTVKGNVGGLEKENAQTVIAWKNIATEEVFYPGNTFTIEDNVTLLAVWGDKATISIDESVSTFHFGDKNIQYVVKGTEFSDFVCEYYVEDEWISTVPNECGVYDVKVIREADANAFYFEQILTDALVIEEREIIIAWCEDNFVFNGEEQTIFASYMDANNNSVPLAVTINKQFKDAGEYTATASFAYGETSYVLPQNATQTFTMKALDIANATITLGQTLVYNGQEQTQSIKSVQIVVDVGVISGEIFKTLNVTYEVKSNSNKAINYDENGYTLTIVGNENFTGEKTTQFMITKATYDMTDVRFEDKSFAFDGNKHSIAIEGTLPIGFDGVQVSVSYDKCNLMEIGQHTVTASFVGSENYLPIANMTAVLTIRTLIIKSEVSGDDGQKIVEMESNEGFDPTMILQLETKVENGIKNKTTLIDYSKQLKQFEKVLTVYDVKLMLNGQEVQLYQIGDGTVIIRILVPEQILNKNFRVVHVHNENEILQLSYDNSMEVGTFWIDGAGYLNTQINNLSEFAFIYEADCVSHWIVFIEMLLFVAFVAVAYFVFKQYKFNTLTFIGIIVYTIVISITALYMHCTLCTIYFAGAILLDLLAVCLFLFGRKGKSLKK